MSVFLQRFNFEVTTLLATRFSDKGFRVIEGFAASHEQGSGMQLIERSVTQLNKLIRDIGYLLQAEQDLPTAPKAYDLYHQIGCESGARFVVQVVSENELWQKRQIPAILDTIVPNHTGCLFQHDVSGILFVAKRNSEPMMLFIEAEELAMPQSSLEIQSRMMTLRDGAMMLKSHFLIK
ncbi:hypothetical protein [Pseudoalteromonas peptidolytica]|uniref:Uncharacterized protein n=1 Tax=Pseudoalteromonas peptidolytica F12-50-A1 TaxID=1315280 RepID=A0A8I0MRR7_9GAMM|nr:hypothetical protein [Pseudoalteromonas peptidolytica]MBE0344574.1 hypothetical protein [Pseudoalteromonas peptidolytica F12-50-A1]GEK10520.1 hypothetical protein PPE03_27690 [Pseudoalteromonas peptidolytica]